MKTIGITLFKVLLAIIYAPLKLCKSKNRIVYLSRQSNEKSIDMKLLEKEISKQDSSVEQVFRLKMMDDGFSAKVKYFFYIVKDMYYLATSKIAIVDTYSITVSCLKHKDELTVIQLWHALGAIKKFGYQSLGTEDGRDEETSRLMCMHKNYDYVISPSAATAKFYMEAFNVEQSKIKICAMPRVDYITDGNSKINDFYSKYPGLSEKKVVLYVPTFRNREAYMIEKLKVEFKDKAGFQLVIRTHPLSDTKIEPEYLVSKEFSTFDLIKIADIVITDYSACAFETAVLMKPLYFFVPDYNEYGVERGLNVDLKSEMRDSTFESAEELYNAISKKSYNMNELFAFKEKYISNAKGDNTELLAKFVLMNMNK